MFGSSALVSIQVLFITWYQNQFFELVFIFSFPSDPLLHSRLPALSPLSAALPVLAPDLGSTFLPWHQGTGSDRLHRQKDQLVASLHQLNCQFVICFDATKHQIDVDTTNHQPYQHTYILCRRPPVSPLTISLTSASYLLRPLLTSSLTSMSRSSVAPDDIIVTLLLTSSSYSSLSQTPGEHKPWLCGAFITHRPNGAT
jgi:hypothetical protein